MRMKTFIRYIELFLTTICLILSGVIKTLNTIAKILSSIIKFVSVILVFLGIAMLIGILPDKWQSIILTGIILSGATSFVCVISLRLINKEKFYKIFQ